MRNKKTKVDVKEGVSVRISKVKGQFEKGFLPNWSREEFFVDKIHTKFLPSMVTLKDHKGEIIEGNFYRNEIQRIEGEKDDDIYAVIKLYEKSERMDKYGIL